MEWGKMYHKYPPTGLNWDPGASKAHLERKEICWLLMILFMNKDKL